MTNETAPTWRKASASCSNGQCVEVARAGRTVLIRDSKNTTGPVLRFNQAQWRRIAQAAKEASRG